VNLSATEGTEVARRSKPTEPPTLQKSPTGELPSRRQGWKELSQRSPKPKSSLQRLKWHWWSSKCAVLGP